jgi:8-oxo-dGTP pyrophosphatase MutT (NUDIX family)
MDEKPIKTISSRMVYQNKWSRVREDVIERSNGERGIYGVLDKDPACIVIPIEQSENGPVLTLVHQYRYCVDGSFYEFPQGGWEQGPDVDVEALARGELREETGLLAGNLTLLGANWIAYGAMRQRHYIWLAEELTQGESALEAEEHGLTVHKVSVDEFERMIFDGRVEDNCTLAAWGTYLVWKRQRAGAI